MDDRLIALPRTKFEGISQPAHFGAKTRASGSAVTFGCSPLPDVHPDLSTAVRGRSV
jgi:hypothetical protein